MVTMDRVYTLFKRWTKLTGYEFALLCVQDDESGCIVLDPHSDHFADSNLACVFLSLDSVVGWLVAQLAPE